MAINNGYQCILNNQYVHRILWEDNYGGIPENCVIHHVDGNRLNNEIYNLVLMSKSEHSRYHASHRSAETRIKLQGTGSVLTIEPELFSD